MPLIDNICVLGLSVDAAAVCVRIWRLMPLVG